MRAPLTIAEPNLDVRVRRASGHRRSSVETLSMLDLLAAGRHDELLAETRGALDFSSPA